MANIKRIGVLTAGGDCPGLNAVVRAVSKNALRNGIQVYGFKNGFDGVVRNDFIKIDDLTVSNILTQGGTILGTSNIANPFQYTLEPYGSPKAPKDISDVALKTLEDNKIDVLITIGGDGTLSMSQKFIELGVPIVGVPKTIDNDLSATDQTFGFDTAMSIATEAIDRIHTTAQSHHRVMVVETMGRYAGWIALRSGIAGGGDVILIPEIPYNDDVICQAIEKRKKKGKNFSIIVAAEGAKNEKGEMTVMRTIEGSTDAVRLGGISQRVSNMVEERTGFESRVVILGHLQRGGIPTAYDRLLSTRFGAKAVDLILEGKTKHMVSLKGQDITDVLIKDAVAKLKLVDPKGQEVKAAIEVGTSFGSKELC
ncbi:6-phosphofructokinase 1 [Parelusimicrobium proximum]|uniref:6-phosphofructokinase n=1 Tax=Parelusimicrobium proximum TaxID=3228953 RepID=UPI003D186946